MGNFYTVQGWWIWRSHGNFLASTILPNLHILRYSRVFYVTYIHIYNLVWKCLIITLWWKTRTICPVKWGVTGRIASLRARRRHGPRSGNWSDIFRFCSPPSVDGDGAAASARGPGPSLLTPSSSLGCETPLDTGRDEWVWVSGPCSGVFEETGSLSGNRWNLAHFFAWLTYLTNSVLLWRPFWHTRHLGCSGICWSDKLGFWGWWAGTVDDGGKLVIGEETWHLTVSV